MKITRNSLRPLALTLCLFVIFAAMTIPAFAADRGKYIFYVGTYTEDDGKATQSKGIYAYRFDASTTEITPLGLAAETANPSWVVIHPNGKFLYATNELKDYKGPNSGGISAWAIDRATGKLTFLNEMPTRGADPCYASVDRSGKYVLVANYTGGSVAVFPIQPDGSLGEASSFVQHTGHGPNPQRQEAPHAHSVDLSPDNRFAYVDDLGLDQLKVYKFDSSKGTLTPNDPPFAKLEAGAGPRHFALRPDGKFAYVIAEMGHTVTVLKNDAAHGTLQPIQTISTLPKSFKGRNDDAEIQVHPSGKSLYASNRGEDTIAVYTIDDAKGTLTQIASVKAGGMEPRSFEIDPTGKFLFVGLQKSDNVAVFAIDQSSGALTPTGKVFSVAAPVAVKFVKVD